MQVIRHPIFVLTAPFVTSAFLIGSASTSGGAGALTVTLARDDSNNLATFMLGDILILLVESADETITISSPSGWAEVTGSPINNVGNNTRLTVFWKRLESMSEANVVISAVVDHAIAWCLWFRGCVESGDPFTDTSTNTGAVANIVIPEVTTDEENQFVFFGVAIGRDSDESIIEDFVNVNLVRLWNWRDTIATSQGGGGALGTAFAYKETGGATGQTTAIQKTANSQTPSRDPVDTPYAVWSAAVKGMITPLPIYASMLDAVDDNDSYIISDIIVPDDIHVYCYETSESPVTLTHTGDWAVVPDTPIANGGANNTILTMFWRRWIGTEEVDPLVTDPGDHLHGQILSFRGCIQTGNPFDITDNDTGGTGTNVIAPGGTTTTNNCLVIGAVATTDDATGTPFGTWVNADLTSMANLADITATNGNGGGFGVGSGVKATAGLFGDFTNTQTNSVEWCGWMGALKPQNSATPPNYQGQGTARASIFSRQIPLPADVEANDVLVLFVESSNEDVVIAKPTGWAAAGSSPISNVGANPTRLSVFWKRATGQASYPSLSSSHDHLVELDFVVRHCIDSGNPFDVTNNTTGGVGTTATIPGETTTVANTLVVAIAVSANRPSASRVFQDWANVDIESFSMQAHVQTATGNRGALSTAAGRKLTAGLFGNSTVNMDGSTEWAGWVGAFKPKT